jgi:hypothetical protein
LLPSAQLSCHRSLLPPPSSLHPSSRSSASLFLAINDAHDFIRPFSFRLASSPLAIAAPRHPPHHSP